MHRSTAIEFRSPAPYSKSATLLLWCAWIFGLGGIHRIYLGKPVTGVLYLLTWGLFGVGQVLDLLGMGRMVDTANAKQLSSGAPRYLLTTGGLYPVPQVATMAAEEETRLKLLRAAASHDNALSVTQGVMATGKTFQEVENMLDEMARSGYVGIDNHPTTGVVIYTFGDLS